MIFLAVLCLALDNRNLAMAFLIVHCANWVYGFVSEIRKLQTWKQKAELYRQFKPTNNYDREA